MPLSSRHVIAGRGAGWASTPPPRTVQRRRRRRLRLVLILLVVAALLPVPWLHVTGEHALGMAWRLDGRLHVNGQVVDPAGEWYWLTVGRPPLVAEVIRDALVEEPPSETPRDMRKALPSSRPAISEPTAAAVGLMHAGVALPLGLLVQAQRPTLPGYPEVARIIAVRDIELSDRDSWNRARNIGMEQLAVAADTAAVADTAAAAGTATEIAFTTADGTRWTAPGPWLPYEVIDVVDLAPDDLEAAVAVPFEGLLDLAPVDWVRNLSLGSSHGMMVALTTYVDAADPELADGLRVAGTGGIRGDGVVTRIGGLVSKATAARRFGADVLFFPASQDDDLADFSAGGMELVPIETLSDAITWLEHRRAAL